MNTAVFLKYGWPIYDIVHERVKVLNYISICIEVLNFKEDFQDFQVSFIT